MRYSTGVAFRTALEALVRRRSEQTGMPIVRLRKAVTFERLLARLLIAAPHEARGH